MNRILLILVIGVLLGCTSNSNEVAEGQYLRAYDLFQKGAYNEAKLRVDSIRILYPKAYKVIRKGQALKREIELGESRSSFEFYSDQMPLLETRLQQAMRGFRFEKNEKYGSLGLYVLPSQTTEDLLTHSYVRCGVDETGVLYLESLYYGKTPIEHTSLKISDNSGVSSQTSEVPYDGGTNYRASSDGVYREIIRFLGDKSVQVIRFVSENTDKRLTFTFEGKRDFSIPCDQITKEAFRKTLILSEALTDYKKMQEQKSITEQKIYSLEKLIRNSEKSDQNSADRE